MGRVTVEATADATVVCGGGPHRLRWADGGLQALDHPDAEGEGLLVALGATAPDCLEVLAAWEAHRDDLRLLTLGPRHDGDRPVIDPAAIAAVRTGPFAVSMQHRQTAMSRMPPHVRAQAFGGENIEEQQDHLRRHLVLLRLFTLPVPMQARLGAAVAATWLERDPDTPALQAALVGRARPALRKWAADESPVHLTIGRDRRIERTADGVVAELPTHWLVDVWGRGPALVDGRFVLDVVDDGHVRAVDRDGTVGVWPG